MTPASNFTVIDASFFSTVGNAVHGESRHPTSTDREHDISHASDNWRARTSIQTKKQSPDQLISRKIIREWFARRPA
jgi:hypothetical protein